MFIEYISWSDCGRNPPCTHGEIWHDLLEESNETLTPGMITVCTFIRTSYLLFTVVTIVSSKFIFCTRKINKNSRKKEESGVLECAPNSSSASRVCHRAESSCKPHLWQGIFLAHKAQIQVAPAKEHCALLPSLNSLNGKGKKSFLNAHCTCKGRKEKLGVHSWFCPLKLSPAVMVLSGDWHLVGPTQDPTQCGGFPVPPSPMYAHWTAIPHPWVMEYWDKIVISQFSWIFIKS